MDDEVGWVGSLNIGDEYLNDEVQPSNATWFDGLILGTIFFVIQKTAIGPWLAQSP